MAALESPATCCTHRWKIAAPVGEACDGTCSLCGAVRHFTNQRFPFGQPAKLRRTVPPRVAAQPEAGVAGSMSAFLSRHRSGLNESSAAE